MKRPSTSNPQELGGILYRAWNALARTLIAAAEGASEARRMHRAYEELTAMSDVELQDIGLPVRISKPQ